MHIDLYATNAGICRQHILQHSDCETAGLSASPLFKWVIFWQIFLKRNLMLRPKLEVFRIDILASMPEDVKQKVDVYLKRLLFVNLPECFSPTRKIAHVGSEST